MIKKILLTTLIGSFLMSITGCGSEQPPQEQLTVEKITFDYVLDENQADTFTKTDTFNTLLVASPYYSGAQSPHIPALLSLNEEKKIKIADALRLTGEGFVQAKTLKEKLLPFKDAYLHFIGTVLTEEPKLKDAAKDIANQFIQYQVEEELLVASFESIKTDTTNPLATSLLEYQKTQMVLQLADALYHDLGYLIATSSQLNTMFQDSTNMKIIAAWTLYEQQLDKLADLNALIAVLSDTMVQIDFVVKQIKTVDYYSGLASLQFLQDHVADVQTKTATIQPNAEITTEDQVFLKNYADLFVSFGNDLQSAAGNVDKTTLLDLKTITNSAALLPQAHADESSYFDTAKHALSLTYTGGKKVVALGWQGIKKTYGACQTFIGAHLDIANAVTGACMNRAVDSYYGVSDQEIKKNFDKDMRQMFDGYDRGIAGAKVLTTAKEYLEGAEKAVQKSTTNQAEKTFGQGWTSWGIGKTAGLTVDIFTTFGKGVYKLANKESTAGDYASGTLDVGLSFIGGSKVVMKGSQVIAGGVDGVPLIAKGGLNYMNNLFNKMMKAGAEARFADLTKFKATFGELTEAQLKDYLSMELEIATRNAVEKALIDSNQVLKTKFAEWAGGAVNTLADDAISKAYNEFVHKSIKASLKEYFTKDLAAYMQDSLIKKGARASGNMLRDYFDNIVGDALENTLKDKVKAEVDMMSIAGLAPELKDLAGVWDQGQMLITDVIVTDEGKRRAREEGCDLADIEKEKGKVTPMAITLTPTSDHGGTMMLKGEKDSTSQVVAFTYSDGVIHGSLEKDGIKTTIQMNVTQVDGAFKVSGPIEINYGGDLIKFSGTTSATKNIPTLLP